MGLSTREMQRKGTLLTLTDVTIDISKAVKVWRAQHKGTLPRAREIRAEKEMKAQDQ